MLFLPSEKKFFAQYEDMADKIVQAAALLSELQKDYGQLARIAAELNKLEDDADAVVHEIVNSLLYDHTRVTEEKGDIRFFAHNMDNIVDAIEKAVNRMVLYQLDELPPAVAEFIPLLQEATKEIKNGVGCLKNLSKMDKQLSESCIRVNDLENEADRVNRKWLQNIMQKPLTNIDDLRRTIAVKEVLELLEYATDQCEDVANILETFRLKGAA